MKPAYGYRGAFIGGPLCGFWKGRVALHGILKALEVRQGDRVLVPGYTCVVVPAAVHYLGAEPVYVDIDPKTYNISIKELEATAQAEARGNVKAVVVQHTYGLPVDISPIIEWAKKRGVAVIEDCAHTIGSRYRDHGGQWREVGTLGDAAFFSSQWSKPITTGLGGWAVANDPQVAQRIREFHAADCVAPRVQEVARLAVQLAAYHAIVWPSFYWMAMRSFRLLSRSGFFVGSSTDDELAGVMPGDYAKRMSRLQEWVARRKIANLGRLINHRRKLKQLYDDALASAGLPIFQIPAHADAVLLRYPIRVADKERVLTEARRLRIELGDWFNHPLHPKGANVAVLGWREGMCPEGERAAREVVNLPLHSRIGEREVERAVRLIEPYSVYLRPAGREGPRSGR